jgi:lysylphosphatidylglycerol synthetase-like protein (DUF2156 family)
VSSEPSATRSDDRFRPSDIVAGFLATIAIFASAIGVVWHPLRLIPISILLALIAAGMSGRQQRISFAAVLICAVCFFLGMVVAVVFKKPLW